MTAHTATHRLQQNQPFTTVHSFPKHVKPDEPNQPNKRLTPRRRVELYRVTFTASF